MAGSSTDVLILGGGVIGLSIARELHKLGLQDVTIVERGSCGREATWAAAGMLSPQAEADELGPFFDLCSRSRDLYPSFADELLGETGIDIELDRTGTLCVSLEGEDDSDLTARCEWQRKACLNAERLSRAEILDIEPAFSPQVQMGVRFPGDWQVENRKLSAALRTYAELNDICVIENTGAETLLIENGRILGARTAAGKITAATTVVATGAWTSFIKLDDRPLPLNVEPVRGQMVCLEAEGRPLKHVVYTNDGYLVPRQDGRILSGSTTERVGYDTSTDKIVLKHFAELAIKVLPSAGLRVTGSWAGLRPFAPDGLPVIGQINGLKGLTIATGHYRNGILLAPVTAKVVADNIVSGRPDDVFSTFGPQRFSRAAAF
jgi:glycine oxidase